MKKKPFMSAPADAPPGKRVPAPEQEAQRGAGDRHLHRLEEENRRLKLAVADLTLRNQALKLVVGKKW